MDLFNKLQSDLKESLKSKQAEKLSVLRLLVSEIRNRKIDQGDTILQDENVRSLIQKQIKQRKDSIAKYESAGRNDLVAKEQNEVEILSSYI